MLLQDVYTPQDVMFPVFALKKEGPWNGSHTCYERLISFFDWELINSFSYWYAGYISPAHYDLAHLSEHGRIEAHGENAIGCVPCDM